MSKFETDETIDPNSWTTKELVKYLYREMHEIQKNQERMMRSIEKLEIKEEKQKAVSRTIVAVGSAVGAIVGFVVKHMLG